MARLRRAAAIYTAGSFTSFSLTYDVHRASRQLGWQERTGRRQLNCGPKDAIILGTLVKARAGITEWRNGAGAVRVQEMVCGPSQ